LEGIAHCNIFDSKNEDVIFECHIMRVRPKKNHIVPKYLLYFCKSITARKYLMRHSKTTTMTTIDQKDLSSLPIALPSIDEQQKIAEILSAWDNAIEKTRVLIAAKEQQKKALMQQLLTGKKRFREFKREEWKELALKKFLIPTLREVDKPTDRFLALGVRSHCKGTFLKPDSDPSQLAMEKLYVVHEDDLIVNITFAWEGAIAIAKKGDQGALVSHRFPTYTFKRNIVLPEFFKYVITQKRFRYILVLISPGGAGRNRVLSKTDFLKIKWELPSVKEQQKIAEVLQTADREIALLNQKLSALQQQKKGLMQKLLTGKVRVKV
jgi:type I restriction enzyme S subunit